MYVVYPLDKTLFLFFLSSHRLDIDLSSGNVELSNPPWTNGSFRVRPWLNSIKENINVSSKWKLLFGKAETLIHCLRKRFFLLIPSFLIVGGGIENVRINGV